MNENIPNAEERPLSTGSHDEERLLLPSTRNEETLPDSQKQRQYSKLRREASVFSLLPWIFLISVEISIFAPITVTLLQTLICRQTYNSNLDSTAGKCQSDEIQIKLSRLIGYSITIGGISGLYIGPKICAASDRIGRKPVFILANASVAVGLFTNILAYKLWNTVNYNWLLLGCILEGFAQPVVILALTTAYVTDCTEPEKRSLCLSWIFAANTLGSTIGPAIGSGITELCHSIVAPYFIVIGTLIVSSVAMVFLLPESNLDINNGHITDVPRSDSSQEWWRFLSPLSDIYYISQESSQPRNVVILLFMDILFVILSVGTSSITIMYLQDHIHMNIDQVGLYLSAVSLCSTISLIGFTPLVQKFKSATSRADDLLSPSDLSIIQLCLLVQSIGLVIFGNTASKLTAIGSSLCVAFGLVARPLIWSANLNSIPHSKIGRFMGGRGMVENVVSVVAGGTFALIYSATLSTYSGAVFTASGIVFSLSLILSFFLRT